MAGAGDGGTLTCTNSSVDLFYLILLDKAEARAGCKLKASSSSAMSSSTKGKPNMALLPLMFCV